MRFDRIPVIRTQNNQRHFSPPQVLLIPDLLIRRNEQLEARFFRCIQKRTVRQAGLSLKPRRYYRVISLDQKTQFLRNALVEDDSHRACGV